MDAPPAIPNAPLIAVVDDDAMVRKMLSLYVARAGLRVVAYEGGVEALANIDARVAAVCLDLGLDDMPGLTVLKELDERLPHVPVVVVTSSTRVEVVVEAMKAGAYDYLAKPLEPVRLEHALWRAIEHGAMKARVRRLESALGERTLVETLAAHGPAMQEVARSVERVRHADVSVAIMGESGTGKEVVARAIHDGGWTKDGAFVAVNCASIPHSIQESELFGHEKGAFTGAATSHQGKFEQASKGALFLDEVGEMAPATQASLLRVLQERVIVRVGGRTEIPVDARVICATHRDLGAEVRAGRFREDLYFRLVVYPIHLPPLRERQEDLPLLVAKLLARSRIARDREIRAVRPAALAVLTAQRWPGNVRELDNVIQRACLACNGKELDVHHLPPELVAAAAMGPTAAPYAAYTAPYDGGPSKGHPNPPGSHPTPPPSPPNPTPLPPPSSSWPPSTLRAIESNAVRSALDACNGNITAAARMLGVSRTKLYRDLKKG